jgi:hypothetical protein
MAANYEVAKDGFEFGGRRFSAGDPISLDAMERAGRGKTDSFLRLGLIRERPGYRPPPRGRTKGDMNG